MKKILFLLLFPCLALAQYQGNANQKITLGEQTTADGLVFRGVANDTNVITPFSDTSAYIILDTVNSKFYHYNRTTTFWALAGGGGDSGGVTSFSAGTTGLTPSTATTGAVTLGGTLAVANGGTGSATQNFVDLTITQSIGGAKTFTSAVTATKLNVTDSIQSNSGIYKINSSTLGLNVDNTTPFRITTGGNWGIYNDNPQNLLSTFSSSARGGLISNSYPILMFNEVGNSKFVFGLDANEGYLWGYENVKLRIATNNTEKMRIETNGNVGIGTASPQRILTVYNFNAATLYQTPTSGTGANDGFYVGQVGDVSYVWNYNSFPLAFGTAFTERMRITAAGNVGIGTATPLALLNVMGTVRINSASAPDANYYLQLENSSSQKAKANAWDTYSDKRIKTDIQPIVNAIDKVNLLNPVYYQKHDSYVENDFLNIDFDSSVKSLGFIAQEVYNVIPEAVNTGTTNELWAMDYTKIIPILTKAIQEQQALIKALEQRIINLENK